MIETPNTRKLITGAMLLVFFAVLGYLTGGKTGRRSLTESSVRSKDESRGASQSGNEEKSTIMVEITGAVVQPGLYEIPVGSRVYQLIELAGGFTVAANPEKINRAEMLKDGQKLVVPFHGRTEPSQSSNTSNAVSPVQPQAQTWGSQIPSSDSGTNGTESNPNSSPISTSESITAIPADSSENKAPVSINRATLEELDQIPGIGPGIADRIIQYRKEMGGFSTIDELKQVKGIGERLFEQMLPWVTL